MVMTQHRRVIVVLLGLASLAVAAWPHRALAADEPPATKPAARDHFKVFLLIGQSNMAGRGKVEEEDRRPHPRVLVLDKADEWAPAADPLHFDKPQVAGVGPGLAFGRAVADALPGDTIGLVPCAVGGTSIGQWKPGGKLYAEAVRRAKVALRRGTLAGILWHQGEADSGTDEKVDAYPKQAAALFAALRKDLDAADVPVVIGTLGDFIGERADRFNAMAKKLPDAVPHSGVADAAGLKEKGDRLHFDAPSAREFGRRYAKAWMALSADRPAAAGPTTRASS